MASAKISLRNIQNAEGLYPVVLRITDKGKSNIISLKINCKKTDWNNTKREFRKSYQNHISDNELLEELMIRANGILRNYEKEEINFSFKKFKAEFFAYKDKSTITVYKLWDDHTDLLFNQGRTGSARFYRDCLNSFFSFIENKDLTFDEIDTNLIEKYEIFQRKNGCTNGGIKPRMRALRAIYNLAIKKGFADQKDYPFRNYKIEKLKSKPEKRALSFEEIVKIRDLNLEERPDLINSKNYFIFSYYSRGMNFYDMLLLQWKNIENEKIKYHRHKTKDKFVIAINQYLSEILSYYKSLNSETSYVFPILLKDGLTPIQIEYRKHKTLSKYNKDLKEIAKLCGIDKNITSYVARHSYATNLKHKDVSVDIISESMGHKNVAITQAYLKEFDNSVIDEAVKVLE